MKFYTAEEILTATPESVSWVVRPWIAQGAITELLGKPKEAGKTTLALAMVRCVLEGVPFLEEAVTKGPVVYLTEESKSSFGQAIRRAGIGPHPDFHVLLRAETYCQRWNDIIARAANKAREVGAALLVVDTLVKFAALEDDTENSAGHVMKAMTPVQEARDSGIGVLLIRHERKAGGSVAEAGRGSSAFEAEVDIIMQLRRPPGHHRPTIRTIKSEGRFDETPEEVNIELAGGTFVTVGAGSSPTREDAKRELLNKLPFDEASALELDSILELDVHHQLIIPRTTAQRAVDELMTNGMVGRIGGGVKGKPYKYYRCDSAQTLRP